MKKILFTLACLLLAGLLLAGCGSGPTTIEGAERDEFAAAADPLADSVVNGIDANDYSVFSQYFDQAMLEGLNETAFNELVAMFDGKLGDYQSRTVKSVQTVENLIQVEYKMVYTQAPEVTMRLILNDQNPPQITGLWFDASELRK